MLDSFLLATVSGINFAGIQILSLPFLYNLLLFLIGVATFSIAINKLITSGNLNSRR